MGAAASVEMPARQEIVRQTLHEQSERTEADGGGVPGAATTVEDGGSFDPRARADTMPGVPVEPALVDLFG